MSRAALLLAVLILGAAGRGEAQRVAQLRAGMSAPVSQVEKLPTIAAEPHHSYWFMGAMVGGGLLAIPIFLQEVDVHASAPRTIEVTVLGFLLGMIPGAFIGSLFHKD
ncbi:MAG: hypothetical protein ABIZ70_10890 [Gemmatimonadales bacterium]